MADHFNGLTPAEAERLALLLEEMGEAQQVIGKILRHGYRSTHPDGGPTNRESLEREIGDVLAVIHMMKEGGDLDNDELTARAKWKLSAVTEYLHHHPWLQGAGDHR